MKAGTRILDLGSGSGEMLCTWARDHGIRGIGVDMSALFSEQAKLRAEELGVADRVTFIHQDAAGYVAEEKCDIAACVGATWIAGEFVPEVRAELTMAPKRHATYTREYFGWGVFALIKR